VGAVASLLGHFTVFGLEFLAYWRLIFGGFLAQLVIFSAIWGSGIAYFVWNGRARWLPSGRSGVAYLASAILLAFLALYWLKHHEYQCLLVAMPFLGLVIFVFTIWLQDPIVRPIRQAGQDGIAFVVLLCFEGVTVYLSSEVLALDHYRKGLAHYQKDHQVVFTIPSSAQVDFFFDYVQREIVLKAKDSEAVLKRPPLPDFDCHR
jgi:hypothetical protein